MKYLRNALGSLATALNWLRGVAAPSGLEAAATVGFLLLSVGCGMAWLPLGLIVPGAILFGGSTWVFFRGGGGG